MGAHSVIRAGSMHASMERHADGLAQQAIFESLHHLVIQCHISVLGMAPSLLLSSMQA
jgi:hypothetical protein